MLLGSIDAVTSSGYIEGWAFDPAAPLRPLTVSVVAGPRELALGLANRFRSDLTESGCGTGWCSFRLRLSASISQLRHQTVSLRDATQLTEICRATALRLVKDDEPSLVALDDVIASDPTLVHAIEQLRGCGSVLWAFIAAEGVEAFVRAAFVYVLGRPADATSLAQYAAAVQNGSLRPYELVRTLYTSDEFLATPQQLLAPPEPGFLFQRP